MLGNTKTNVVHFTDSVVHKEQPVQVATKHFLFKRNNCKKTSKNAIFYQKNAHISAREILGNLPF